MKKITLFSWACLGIGIGMLFPTDISASQTSVYGAQEILKIGNNLKDFMFNIAVPYAGGIFGGVNIIRSFMANNYQAMAIFALLTASSFIIPPFLNGVFGSSLLIP